MPVYDFKCPKCDRTRTDTISIHVYDYQAICNCGTRMLKVFTAPPVHFKAGGFYSTENKK